MQKKTKEEKIVKQMINAVRTKFFHLLKAKSLGYSMMGAIWCVCVCVQSAHFWPTVSRTASRTMGLAKFLIHD